MIEINSVRRLQVRVEEVVTRYEIIRVPAILGNKWYFFTHCVYILPFRRYLQRTSAFHIFQSLNLLKKDWMIKKTGRTIVGNINNEYGLISIPFRQLVATYSIVNPSIQQLVIYPSAIAPL